MKAKGVPDGFGRSVSDCGDTIEFSLYVRDGEVFHVEFAVAGCNFTLACAKAAAALAKGVRIAKARDAATPEKIDRAAGGLPEANKHCALLASQAMEEAVADALTSVREPWRKLYRT